jgi:predicted tellurium resistance membrane protein TerC
MDPMLTTFGTLVAVAFTVMIFSYPLYRENRIYRFAEFTSVAAAVGNATVVAVRYLYSTNVTPAFKGDYLAVITMLFSFLLFATFLRKYAYVTRLPMSFLVGVGSGVALRTVLQTQFVGQIWGTMIPLTSGSITPIDNLIIAVSTVLVIAYFLMSKRYSGKMAAIPKCARYFMMVFFGATLGTSVATFVIWCSGRILFILRAIGLV